MQIIKGVLALSAVGLAAAQLTQCKIDDTGKDSAAEFELFSKFASAAYCPSLFEGPTGTQVCDGDKGTVCAGLQNATTLLSFPQGLFNIAGYIAKSEGPQPFVVVAFKGTESKAEWLVNAAKLFTDASDLCSGCRMHSGFLGVFNKVKDVTKAIVQGARSATGQEDTRVVVTGHSLGGAVATIMATFLRGEGVPCDLYTYGSPKVGNNAFIKFAASQGGFSARITNGKDVIPALPPSFFGLLPYEHTSPEYWYEKALQEQEDKYEGERNCCESEAQCSVTQCTNGFFGHLQCSITDHFTKAYADGFNACGLSSRQGAADGLDIPDEPTLEVLQGAVERLQREVQSAGVN